MTDTTEPLDSAWDWVADHTRRYVESDGAESPDWKGLPILVLTTVGRRSGRPRRNALIYGVVGDRYVVVASKGGDPHHPLWYRNLADDPEVHVQGVPTSSTLGRAPHRPRKKARLWPAMVAIWPSYDDYQAKTDRDIPVVVLDRT